MANFKHKRLAMLLGRVTTVVVGVGVVAAIGMAMTCPWLCDRTALAGERCQAPALAQHHESEAPSLHPRWHAGDKF